MTDPIPLNPDWTPEQIQLLGAGADIELPDDEGDRLQDDEDDPEDF